jgi:5-bromo-4-chloroindolyl phosphate hydrolysis protein
MDKTLEQILDEQFNDELTAVLEYHEIVEKMNRERSSIKDVDKHIHTLRSIQKEQAIHGLEIANMIMDLEFREPKRLQELEDFFHREEHSDEHS